MSGREALICSQRWWKIPLSDFLGLLVEDSWCPILPNVWTQLLLLLINGENQWQSVFLRMHSHHP